MTDEKQLTVTEKLLVAAGDLDEGKGKSFTAEDLVVAAWRRFPRTFGLRGHNDAHGVPAYPDSNRVFAEIMGSKPIRKRGQLVKVGEKTYQLTASGREAASALTARDHASAQTGGLQSEGKSTMSRNIQSKLERLLQSRAVQRAQNAELDRITFHDACLFWNITPRSTSIELEGNLADVRSVIEHAEAAVKAGVTELRQGDADLPVTATQMLCKVHDYLQEKFSDELSIIRKRTDQRKT